METQEMRTELLNSLSVLYDMEALAPLLKFLQGEMRVMYYLFNHQNEEVYVSKLSEIAFVSRSRITAVVNSLKKKGLLILEPCEHDRRRVKVRLTKDGVDYTFKEQQTAFEYFDWLVLGFGKENIKELIRLIDLAGKVMGKKEELA